MKKFTFIHFPYYPFTVFSNYFALSLIKDLRWQKFVMPVARRLQYLPIRTEKCNVPYLYFDSIDSIKCLLKSADLIVHLRSSFYLPYSFLLASGVPVVPERGVVLVLPV